MGETKFGLDDFGLYQSAREFRKKVYRLIRQLPREEKFSLDPQMRRAAISVSNNIAEGHGRWYHKENMRFCRIARGSVEELLDDFNLCGDEQYGNRELVAELREEAGVMLRRINSYIGYLKKCRQGEED